MYLLLRGCHVKIQNWNNFVDNYTEASKSMCAEGEVYCWMNCLPAPTCNSDQQLSCYNDQHVQCCSDYNDEPCENMDGTCHWECASNGASDSICSINLVVVVFCIFITKLTSV